MVRIKRGVTTKNSHKKILAKAKGYFGRASSSIKIAIERVEKGLQYQYRDRRRKKLNFESLWIQRINSFCKQNDTTYSVFVHKLKQEEILLNKKVLSMLSVQEPKTFMSLIKITHTSHASE